MKRHVGIAGPTMLPMPSPRAAASGGPSSALPARMSCAIVRLARAWKQTASQTVGARDTAVSGGVCCDPLRTLRLRGGKIDLVDWRLTMVDSIGVTVRDGAIVCGNFSWLSEEEFRQAIVDAVDAMPERIEVSELVGFRSEYIEPSTREGYLEGTRYGQGGAGETEAGRDGVRGRQGDDRPGPTRAFLDQLADSAVKRRAAGIERAGRGERDGGVRPVKPESLRDRPGRSFGQARPYSVRVGAFHCSKAPRATLSTAVLDTAVRSAGVVLLWGLPAQVLHGWIVDVSAAHSRWATSPDSVASIATTVPLLGTTLDHIQCHL